MRVTPIVAVGLLVLALLSAPIAAQEGSGTRAELAISQPEYVDSSVDVERTENATVYHVRGPSQEIEFQNANYSNVTAVGVLDGPGAINPNDATRTFTFDADGKEATTRVFFDVRKGGETTRYVADIRVSDVEWAHLPADKHEEQQEALSTWEEIKRDAQRIVPGQDPIETIEDGLGYARFFDSPFSSFKSDMQGTLIMLFMTPGGLSITGLLLGTTVLMLARSYRYRNRMEKQLEDIESIDQELDAAWLQMVKDICLQQVDLNDLFPDHIARSMRDYFGRNTWLAFKQYTLLRSPTSVKGTMLQLMGQSGYVGHIERDSTGAIVEAHVTREQTRADGGDAYAPDEKDLEKLDYANEDDREFIELVPPDELDDSVFDEDLDIAQVSFPIDNREVSDSELIDELDPEFPGDFEDREQMARVLASLVGYVANHSHTDDDGLTRREKDLVSFLMEMDSVLHEDADFPPAYRMQQELLYVADRLDKGDRLRERVDATELDGIGGGRQIDIGGGS